MRAQPDEDLESLLCRVRETQSLDYAYSKIGDLNPDADLGAGRDSLQGKIHRGRNWWNDHKDEMLHLVCASKTLRTKGPLRLLQLIFGSIAGHFEGPLATYATIIFVEQQFGDTLNNVTKEMLQQLCNDSDASSGKRTAPARGRRPKRLGTKEN